MRINLLAILLFEAENHLYRRQGTGSIIVRLNQFLICCDGELSCIFELETLVSAKILWRVTEDAYNMRHGFLAVDVLLHHTILVYTDSCQDIECLFVAGVDTVKHKADHDFLPSRPTFVPEFCPFDVDDVTNILHHAVQCTGCQHFVLIIVRNSNQKLGMTIVHRRA